MVRSQRKKPVHRSDGKALLQETHPASSRAPSSPSEPGAITGQVKKDRMSPNASTSYDPAKHNPRPTKRLKTNTGSAIPSTSVTDSSATQDTARSTNSTRADPGPSLPLVATEIQHLHDKYDISTISIISSSKIHQKVNNLIARVEKFTFANVSAKPGVVVLQAKAASASKMISVVEIAKADIGKRGGKWYEYSKLHPELLGFKEKQRKQPLDGRTLADAAPGRSSTANGKAGPQCIDVDVDVDDDLVDDKDHDSDGEVAFETLQHQSVGAVVNGRSKVRATPIMTIYLACVPVPGLKDLLG
ncbi:MAG: hypothetical protein L6R38_000390 [Xanthoria sp. 2 TBL-2021]|nr:MAG: hypothetical protein L6R38_000390 [Xanthoria sp. 2 TBL-2021]